MPPPVRSCALRLTERLASGEVLRVALVGAAGTGKSGVVERILQDRRASVVVIDDAEAADPHRLEQAMAALSEPATSILICLRSLRPTNPTLALLIERIIVSGELIELGPLDDDELAAGAAGLLGTAIDTDLLRAVSDLTGNDPTYSRAILQGWAAEGMLERGRLRAAPTIPRLVHQLIAARSARVSRQARITLAAMVTAPGYRSIGADLELAEAGLSNGSHGVVPVVAEAIRAALAADELEAADVDAARWLAKTGSPTRAAEIWQRIGPVGDETRQAFLAAGVAARTTSPRAALDWFTLAQPRTADEWGVQAATLILAEEDGHAVEQADRALRLDPAEPQAHATIAAALARANAWATSADRISRIIGHPTIADEAWTALRLLARIAAGEPGGPLDAADDGVAPNSAAAGTIAAVAGLIRRSSDADGAGIGEVVRSLPAVIATLGDPGAWLDAPFGPHEWVAALCLAMGDARTAAGVLAPFGANPHVGVAAARARALSTWVDVRLGRSVDPASVAAITDPLIALAVRVGMARRAGDIREGGELTREVSAALGRMVIGPLNLDPALELLVAARRFGPRSMAEDLGDRITAVLAPLPSPVWRIRWHWAVLEGSVAAGEFSALDAPTAALSSSAAHLPAGRQLARAAAVWRDIGAGAATTDRVEESVEELREIDLVWEAAQLAGQAALRSQDAGVAKQLLVKARSLRAAPTEGDRTVTPAGLSEREVEVAELVLEGLTHRDIGERLYISPKTVEHHVAHIRTKLGVTTRAEFLAAVRHDLADRSG